jgi:hypothetical protein
MYTRDDQPLREGRGWSCAAGGQDWINSPRNLESSIPESATFRD